MGGAVERPGRRGLDLPGQIDVADAVFGGLRRRVGRAPILLEQFGRHGRGRAEIVVGRADVEMKFAAVVPVADIAVEASHIRRREVAKAVVVQSFERAVNGEIVDLLAPLRRTLHAAERTAHGVDFGAVIVEAVLHLHHDGAAQRIQSERGIVGHQVDGLYRGGRNQIPVHGIAERLIDAHAVLINRKPLGGARYRRSNEAAKFHVRLKRIAGNFTDGDARHVLTQGVGDVQRPGLLDLIGVNQVDARRYLVRIGAGAGKRRGIYQHSRYGPSHAGSILIAAAFDAGLGPGHHDGRQLNGVGGILGACGIAPCQQAYRYWRDKQELSVHSSRLIPQRIPAPKCYEIDCRSASGKLGRAIGKKSRFPSMLSWVEMSGTAVFRREPGLPR